LLDTLTDLARVLRGKAEAIAALKKAKDERLRKRQARVFDRQAREVFDCYEKYLDDASPRAARWKLKRPRRDPREAENQILADLARVSLSCFPRGFLCRKGPAGDRRGMSPGRVLGKRRVTRLGYAVGS
jgi:hypothetical protein